MRPNSQNARLLAVLRDGPATNRQIHERAGHMIVNSRVAELRDKDYVIECEHLGGSGADAYRYTLLSEPGSSAAVADTALTVDESSQKRASGTTVLSEMVGERQGWRPGSESSVSTIGAEPMLVGHADPATAATPTSVPARFAEDAPSAPRPRRSPGGPQPLPAAGATQLTLEVAA